MLPAWDEITTSDNWMSLTDDQKRAVHGQYAKDLQQEPSFKSLSGEDQGKVFAQMKANAGFDLEEPGFFETTAKGAAHGVLGLAKSAGLATRWLGGKTGSDTIKEAGDVAADFWGKEQTHFEKPEEWGTLWENPGLLKKASYWGYSVADMLPSFGAAIIPGVGAHRYIKIAGNAIKLTPKVVGRLATLGAGLAGGTVGGALEGTNTYEESLKQGATEEQAAAAGELMTLAAGVLNAIPVGKALTPAKRGKLIKYLTTGVAEAVTEWAEEPTEAAILQAGGMEGDVVEAMKQGVDVIPAAFLLGGGMGAIGQRAIRKTEEAIPPTEKKVSPDKLRAAPLEELETMRQDPRFADLTTQIDEVIAEKQAEAKPSETIAEQRQVEINRLWAEEEARIEAEEGKPRRLTDEERQVVINKAFPEEAKKEPVKAKEEVPPLTTKERFIKKIAEKKEPVVLPDVIRTKKDTPFKTKGAAILTAKAKKLGPEYQPVQVEDGWELRKPEELTPTEKLQAKVEAEVPLGKRIVDEIKQPVDAAIAADKAGRAKIAEKATQKAQTNAKSVKLADGPEVEALVDEQLGRLPKAEAPKEVALKAKEPWEMKQADWIDGHIKSPAMHKEHVKIALSENKPVPDAVLVEYPDLKATLKVEAKPLAPKEQKKYLIDEIDKAIEEAPTGTFEKVYLPYPEKWRGTLSKKELQKIAETTEKELSKREKEYGTITIHVPDDGDFEIINSKAHLQEFKKRAKKFLLSTLEKKPYTTPSKKPIGKRMEGEVEYYNKYEPRKQELVEAYNKEKEVADQHYKGGWFSEGHYAIRVPRSQIKQPVRTGKEAKDIQGAIPKVGLTPATILGETRFGPKENVPVVHVKGKDGAEVFLNAKYVDVVFTNYPDAKPSITVVDGPVVFKSKGKTVAVVMPMRESGLPEKLAGRPGELFPEEYPEAKPEPEAVAPTQPGLAYRKGKQIPFREYREITRGKDRGKIQVTWPEGRKGIIEKADVIRMPEIAEKLSTDIDQAKSRIKSALKDQRGSFSMKQKDGPAIYKDLVTVGKHIINQGHTKFSQFSKQLKATLGNTWAKVKNMALKIFADAKRVLKSERGAITFKEAPYGEKPLSPTAQSILDEITMAETRKATPADKKGVNEIKEHFKALGRGLDPRKTGLGKAVEHLVKSPEWYDHPAQRKATEVAIDRSSLYHENFNEFNQVDDINSPFDTVTDALVALGRKGGISKFRFLTGRRSKEYEQLEEILDEADIQNKVHTVDSLRKAGVNEDIIHVWSLVRASFDKQLEAMQKPMRDLIAKIEEQAKFQDKEPVYPDFGSYIDKNGKKRPLNLKEALLMMGQYKGSYAPRIREPGNWVVQGKFGISGQRIRQHKRSKVAAEFLATSLRKKGYSDVKVSPKEQLLEETFSMIRVMEVGAAIERAAKEGEGLKKYDTELQMMFLEDMLTSASDLIKSRGARATMIRRRKGAVIAGYMTDPLERFIRYTSNNSGGMAKAETAQKLFNLLFGEYKAGKKVGGVDQAKEPQTHRAMRKYIEEQLRNPERADRVIGLLKSIATFKYLGFNPRSITVNITSLVTTAPVAIHQYVMDGKGGFTKIGLALSKASKDYGKAMTGKKLENKDEQAFILEQKRKGYADPQYTREASGHIQGAYGTAWSKAMGSSMWAFGKSEEWVRGATMLAGFRLARKNGLSPSEATKKAKVASDRAHGIYGKETLPSWAQGTGPAARVGQMVYVYAKFPHNALQMYYDVGVKKKNVKGIIYALAAPAVLSGIAAFPLKDTIIAFANAMLKALGDDRDAEKMVYDTIREQLGERAEKAARLGVLGEMGIDVSGSLAMGPGSLPKELLDLTGAIGGVAKDISEAGRFIRTGQPGRAIEKALPGVGANILRAIRELRGATTRRGYPVWDKRGRPLVPAKGETALRVAGFRSARQARLAQKTWEGKREQARFNERRKRIYEKVRAYISNRDQSLRQEINDDIAKYNRAAYRAGTVSLITRQSIAQQIRRMTRPTAKQRRAVAR